MAPPASAAAPCLVLDDQTLKDLEIFEAQQAGESLFDFCNLASTEGGSRALKRRMQTPMANADDIRETQQAIAFVLRERAAFDALPSAYATGRVSHFMNEVLPIVAARNPFEFGLGAASMWANHDRHYLSITLGVQVTSSMIQALRNCMAQPALDQPEGELAALVSEVKSLLALPGLDDVSATKPGTWPWRVLRHDQVFRLYEKDAILRLLALTYEIDALVSMADVTSKFGYVIPTVCDGALKVEAEDVVHPFVAAPVANPVSVTQNRRVLFLTGPNMAGKTTYLRSFSTALYLAHLGMGVPASRFEFVPADRLFSSISLSDDLRGGISYFRAEALRVKAVAEAVATGQKVVAVMDEPFKGTNVKDAFDASKAILLRFAKCCDCLFLFSSHLIELASEIELADGIDCRFFEAETGGGKLRFEYRLQTGVSSQRLGMRVLEEEGVFDLLDGV